MSSRSSAAFVSSGAGAVAYAERIPRLDFVAVPWRATFVDDDIAGDGEQPRAYRPLIFADLQMLPSTNQRLLQHIFGPGLVTGQLKRVAPQLCGVPFVQCRHPNDIGMARLDGPAHCFDGLAAPGLTSIQTRPLAQQCPQRWPPFGGTCQQGFCDGEPPHDSTKPDHLCRHRCR
jgi:hypothetical protein